MEALADIKSMVERIVSEVLESRMDQLRAEVVQRVAGELQPLLVQREGPTALLNVAVNAIQESASQSDILNSVLDGSTNFSARSILFVTRADSLIAWNARGFAEGATRDLKISATQGPAADVVREATMQRAKMAEILGQARRDLGEPVQPNAVLLPMKVREKVPAVLYADSGATTPDRLDAHALQLLVRSAALWLEIVASRRGAQPALPLAAEAPTAGQGAAEPPAEPGQRATGEGPAPERVATAPVGESKRPEPPVAPAPRVAEPAPKPSEAGESAAPPNGADNAIHHRARRFAKLLVDEIILYNGGKVSEGRKHRDLYERLRDDIDKSRAAYEKRFGATPAGGANYFNQELVSNLAQNDRALLGSSFAD